MSFIQDFMASLDNTTLSGTAALDQAVQASSNSKYNLLQDVLENLIGDCKAYNGNYKGFLEDKCGIILDNEDTGAITGSDAGGSTVKNASDVVPESGSVDTNFKDDSFEINGLTVKLQDANFSDLNSKQKYIWQALRSWWVKSALNLNAESYGNNFSFTDQSSATTKTIWFRFTNENDGSFAWVTPTYSHDAVDSSTVIATYGLRLAIEDNVVNQITEGDPDGKFKASGDSDTTQYLDRTLAHEFTHAVMAANIQFNTYESLPQFAREGIAELTCGIDDKRRTAIENLAKNSDSLKAYLSDNRSDIDEIDNPYAAGYILFRYLNKQVANSSASGGGDTPSTPTGGDTPTIPASVEDIYIQIPTISGGVSIVGTGTDEVLNGSSDEKNSYVYNSGNVTISNYESWENVVFNGTYQNLAVDGNDFVVNAAEGSVRIRDARGKLMEFVDNNNNALLHVCMQKDDDTFNGTTYHEALAVIGANNASNQIYAGSGGSTLWGGAGRNSNDILIGGDGTDMFVYNYGNGNDEIFADEEDIVNFGNVNLGQIRGVNMKDNRTLFVFDDLGSLNVFGRAGSFILDGQTYNADYDNKQFKAVSDN